MSITLDLIHGLCFGIEYIGKNLEEGLEESVVVIDFACFRTIIWTGDYE